MTVPAGLRCLVPAGALMLLATACVQPLRLARDDSPVVLAEQRIMGPSPATRGPHRVLRMYYGSGTDRRRAEYRDSVTLRTRPVDGSKLATASPQVLADRRAYWGFGLNQMPVNGRVWYPEGEGPFPLVLIVHGNHNMRDFSDPGYAYLGELLASRGYILVSVDQNFLNGGLGGENDARGWMLLKHLEAWRQWNDSAGGPFHRKVDMERIALMGHSRGGEAVAVAAAFNGLAYYPDDFTVRFDFGFQIESIVAIAPVDGQYTPANRPTPVSNVNYLVFHGSHDGDVTSFVGLRQYQRVRFTDGQPRFKAAFWMYRANHGQWNTRWRHLDNGPTSPRGLDLRGLLPLEDQLRFGEVVISAFLDATLQGRTEYLPLFQDHRSAGHWLPKTIYLTRFQESGFRPLAQYMEDVDLTTGTAPGVRIEGDSLSTWREGNVRTRSTGNNDLGYNAVWLGWNNRIAGPDTTRLGRPAAYRLRLPPSLAPEWGVGRESALQLSLLVAEGHPGPRTVPRDTTVSPDSSRRSPARPAPQPRVPPGRDTTTVELSVEFVDAAGVQVRLRLNQYGPVRRPPEMTVRRRAGRDRRIFATLTEQVLQTFTIPLADALAVDPRFDPARLVSVGLVFDRTAAGTVVMTDLGLTTLDAAYLAPAPGGGR